jgi:MFS transporter, ACS family, D-galactonate transporter
MSRRWVVVGLIFLGIMISYVDRGNLAIAASPMMHDFGLPPATMGMLLSAFFWTYALFQIPAGAVVDRIGIRRVYAGAFLVWSLASASIAVARGATDVLAMRLVLGLAEAVGPIASLSFIRRNFAGPEQGLPTAIYIGGQNAGPALGALLGTMLLDRFGWRMMFALTGLGALLWLPGWWALAPRDDAAAPKVAPPTAAPGVAPLQVWSAVAGSGAFWAMLAAIFLSSYYWYFVLTWVPAYLTMVRGFSTLEMGWVLSVPLFVMAVLNIVAGRIADGVAKRCGNVFRVRLTFAAVAYLCAGALLLLLVVPGRGAVMPILTVSMCAIGIGNSNYWALSQHTPPPELVGRTIGFLNTVAQIAGVAAPLITGWILGPQRHFGPAIAIAGGCALLAAMCLLLAGAGGLERLKGLLAQA